MSSRPPQRLRDAADVISGNPASLQLRYLQTLTEIGATQNSTVVFPLPMDVIKPFLEALQPSDGRTVNRSGSNETISSSSSPSLTRPAPDDSQRPVVASGRSVAPGPVDDAARHRAAARSRGARARAGSPSRRAVDADVVGVLLARVRSSAA